MPVGKSCWNHSVSTTTTPAKTGAGTADAADEGACDEGACDEAAAEATAELTSEAREGARPDGLARGEDGLAGRADGGEEARWPEGLGA